MSQESNSAKGICRIFASGKTCRFGETCRYLHSQNQQNESLSGKYQDSSGGFDRDRRRLCQSYVKTRFCKFGAKCRYQHSLPQENLAEASETRQDGILNQEDRENASGSSSAVSGSEKPYFSLPLPNAKNGNRLNNEPKNASRSYGNAGNSSTVSDVKPYDRNPDNVTNRNVRGRRPPHGAGRSYRSGRGVDDLRNAPTDAPRDSFGQQQQPKDSQQEAIDDATKTVADPEKSLDANKSPQQPQNRAADKPRRRLCRYYKAGHCSMGKRCRFYHPATPFPLYDDDGKVQNKENRVPSAKNRAPVSKPTEYKLADLTEEETKKIRRAEIDQMMKRYPKACYIVDEPDSWSCQFKFTPTDPDWIFDVKDMVLAIEFPEKYPIMPMLVAVVEEQEMPEAVIRYARVAITDWLQTRFAEMSAQGKAELMFRPFTRWLDRNLEDIFTDGLKRYKLELQAAAAGVQFISGAELQEEFAQKQQAASSSNSEEDEEGSSDSEDDDDYSDSDDDVAPQPSHVGEMPPDGNAAEDKMSFDTARKGTEVKIIKLQLEENAATLRVTKVRVILQCSRCKNKAELLTPGGRINQLDCSKCSQSMLVTFRPCMAHQFSSIIGYMDLVNATPFDLILVDCHFEIGCFNCNKDMRIEGVSIGELFETFCHHCHKKMKINSESVRFQQLEATVELDASDAHLLETKKTKKLPKDPAIQLGKPLPNEGTCKHYKKSFRWLRFPCCGKAYPCDVCHDDAEGDHEMLRANRMICGFCCKEQMYAAEKPCSGCGYHLTKKASSHWEGGKGCRDKIKMSRGDEKKYANMGKTISRKEQAKKEGKKGKKTTKLRHV